MIDIDDSYDVILTYSPIVEITGHVFECFDYWLALRSRYKVGIMFLAGMSIDQLQIAWESKYTISFDEVRDSIIMINDASYSGSHIYRFGKHTVVILCDGNIRALQDRKILFATSKMIGFLCGVHQFEQVKMNTKIIYLQDERIYGKNKYFKSINYVKKLPFKYYKRVEAPHQNIGMLYVTYACKKVTPQVIQDYHYRSGCSKSILVVPYKLDEYEGLDDIEQIIAPVQDFFAKFDTYIYTPVERKFDCSPRLVTECFLQDHDVMIDLPYVDIGLQTRYNDCKENLSSLNLTNDDQIFGIIEKVRNGELTCQ